MRNLKKNVVCIYPTFAHSGRANGRIYTYIQNNLSAYKKCIDAKWKNCMYISDFYPFRMGKRADLYIYTKRFAASKKGRFEVYVDFSPFRMGKRADGPPRGRSPRPTIYTYLHIYISAFHFLEAIMTGCEKCIDGPF